MNPRTSLGLPHPAFRPSPKKPLSLWVSSIAFWPGLSHPTPQFLPLSRDFGIKHLPEGRGLGPLPPPPPQPCFWLDLRVFLQKSRCRFWSWVQCVSAWGRKAGIWLQQGHLVRLWGWGLGALGNGGGCPGCLGPPGTGMGGGVARTPGSHRKGGVWTPGGWGHPDIHMGSSPTPPPSTRVVLNWIFMVPLGEHGEGSCHPSWVSSHFKTPPKTPLNSPPLVTKTAQNPLPPPQPPLGGGTTHRLLRPTETPKKGFSPNFSSLVL